MTVRLGFYGAGFIAAHHLGMLRLGGADAALVAVHDPDAARAEALAAAHGARVVGERELLEVVDAVYVCTWTSEHPRLVAQVVAAGLPVFCEKPLAVDLASARAMTEAVERAGVVNQVGLVLRDYPGLRHLRHLVGRPGTGRVMSVVFRDDQYLPVQGQYGSTWRADPARAGSGTLLEHSIHDLDILEWLVGPIRSVAARTAAFHRIEGIEDVAVVQMELAGGGLATLTSVWHDVLARPSSRRIEVLCENAFLVLADDLFGPVSWTGPDGDEGSLADEELVAEASRLGIAARNPDVAFVEAVAAGGRAEPGFGVALRAHVVADAAYRSAASGGAAVAV